MFGLTTRRRLREEVDAHLTTIRRMIQAEADRTEAQRTLSDEIDAHIKTIRGRHTAEDALDAERRASRLLAEQLLTTAKTGLTTEIAEEILAARPDEDGTL